MKQVIAYLLKGPHRRHHHWRHAGEPVVQSRCGAEGSEPVAKVQEGAAVTINRKFTAAAHYFEAVLKQLRYKNDPIVR